MKLRKYSTALAISAAGALLLASCSGAADNGSGNGDQGELGSISLSYTPGWSDGQSITYLLKNQLEQLGYEIGIEEVADLGPNYAAVANGDIDIHSSAWPEVTQAAYMEEFGDDIESLGIWYENAELFMAVPSYSQIDSLDELADNVDVFDGEIIGMEPGAGLTGVVENSMMPAYGIDESFTLKTSSTQAMLTVLGESIENEEEVILNLWSPFWANTAYDIKPLEDPEGAMGKAEGLHVNATAGFSEEFPEAAELIAGLQLDDVAYGALEQLIISEEYEDDSEGAVEAWLADHPDAFSTQVG